MLTTRLQVVLVVAVLCLGCHRAQSQPEIAEGMDDVLQPYTGPTSQGVDVSTLEGKIMCGYQGWFACEGDSLDRGWYHYNGRNGFRPGSCSIDLWPDMSELGEDERFDTEFRHADGSVAQVYSAQIPRSVDRHFEWMAEYGIDGAFVQRFAGEVAHSKGFEQFTKVLANCRAAANNHGRAYALMYDLSGLPRGGTERVIEDFKTLVDRMGLTRDTGDKAYLHHGGKPVVAVWGIGFNDRRQYTLEECGHLLTVRGEAGLREQVTAVADALGADVRAVADEPAVRGGDRCGLPVQPAPLERRVGEVHELVGVLHHLGNPVDLDALDVREARAGSHLAPRPGWRGTGDTIG